MILTTLTALMESAFNVWLKLDEEAIKRLQALQGRVIAIHVSNPELELYFVPTNAGVQVMASYDAEPDVTLSGSALAFMRLSGSQDSAKTMLENHLQIDGSLGIAEQFSQIIRAVDIDWEELLSHAVGDIAAHQAGEFARSSKGWLDDTARTMRLNTREYLQEEGRLLPAAEEIQQYLDAVDLLRADTDRTAARIRRLQQHLKQAEGNTAHNQPQEPDTQELHS